MVEGARGVERDDCGDQNSSGEMPDEDAVRQRPILAEDRGKREEPEHADRIAISVGSRPAEHEDDEEEEVKRMLRRKRRAPLERR